MLYLVAVSVQNNNNTILAFNSQTAQTRFINQAQAGGFDVLATSQIDQTLWNQGSSMVQRRSKRSLKGSKSHAIKGTQSKRD